VTLVTPHLVKPMAPGAARLSTDKYIEPSDMEIYLLGLQQGRERHTSPPPGTIGNLPPGFGNQKVD
jgi:Flp pilus assembly secretin CpaC